MGEEIIEVTRVIDDQLFRGNGTLDTEAFTKIRQTIAEVNQKIIDPNKQYSLENDGNLKFGNTVIDFIKFDANGNPVKDANGNEVKQSYTDRISDLVKKIQGNVPEESKTSLNDTTQEIAQEIGEKIGLNNEALQKFTTAKSDALKQSLQPVLENAASEPQSSKAAQAVTSEVVEKTGLNNENAERIAPKEPTTSAALKERAANPKDIDKVLIDAYSKAIPEEARKAFQDKATKIANDTEMTKEAKEEALQNLLRDTILENVDKFASETWREKLSRWGDYIIEAFKLLGGLLMFALNLLPAIILIIFSYEFIDRWAKSHTGCFMDMYDSSNTLKKSYKVKGLTCSNDYRNAMKDFEDYPDYIKECTKITPTPAPPQGCQTCDEGIKAGTSDCPCPDRSDSRGVYASQWCDSKFLTSSDGTFSHKYYKRYYSWMDAFEEVGAMFVGFVTGFNPLPDGSFLGKLFQLLEGFGIIALVFVGIYGLLWMAKSFGFLGGGGKESGTTTVVIEEEKHHGETVPQASAMVSQATSKPQVTCATDYSKCTKEELDAINVALIPLERLEEYNNALQDITVSGKDFATQQAKSALASAKAQQEAAKAAIEKQKADQLTASQKEREQQIQEQKLILQQKQHELDLQKLKTQQAQAQYQAEQEQAKLLQKPGQDYASQIKQMEEEATLLKTQALLRQAKEQYTSDPNIIAARKLKEQQETFAKKEREQKDKEAAAENEHKLRLSDIKRQIEAEDARKNLLKMQKDTKRAEIELSTTAVEAANAKRASQSAAVTEEKNEAMDNRLVVSSQEAQARRGVAGKYVQQPAVTFSRATNSGTPAPGASLPSSSAIKEGVEGIQLQRATSPSQLGDVGNTENIPQIDLQDAMSNLLPNQGSTRFRARKSIRASRKMIK